MNQTTFTFNLTSEPWAPVVTGGRPARASLRDLVEQPESFDALDLADPLAAVAVLRQVLLPIWLDALGLPKDHEQWRQRMQQPHAFATRLLEYLDEHRSRFDLFDPVAPFAQVAGLRTGRGELKPISLLQPEQPTGNNVPLFGCRTEADPPTLAPPDAVLALLVAQCFDTAAIKPGAEGDPAVKAGKTTGNPTGPLGQLGLLVPLGATVAQTLALNTPLAGASNDLVPGLPQWRQPAAGAAWSRRAPTGLLDLLTWPARRVRLVPVQEDDRVVVRHVVLSAGDRLAGLPQYELHTAWRREDKPAAGSSPQRPARHRSGRSTWRGLQSLLATGTPTDAGETSSLLLRQLADLRVREAVAEDLRVDVLAVQVVYGNQSAVVEDVFVDLLPLPVAALPNDSRVRELLVDVAAKAAQLQQAANRLGDSVREAAGGDPVPWDRSQRLGDTLVQDLTPLVRRLLSGLQRQPERVDEAERAWLVAARRRALEVAEPVLTSAPSRAFGGRIVRRGAKDVPVRLSSAEAAYRSSVTQILGEAQPVPAEEESRV